MPADFSTETVHAIRNWLEVFKVMKNKDMQSRILYPARLTFKIEGEWIKKLWYIYTMEFYAVERKKELIPFATAWMELESIMLSEISQAVRDNTI